MSDLQLRTAAHTAAIELLRKNTTPAGVLAASRTMEAEARRYTRIFGRDAAICALGMAISGDPELLRGARASLLTLAEHQAENGQVPKYVDPEGAEPDFWYVGCIDATLWWLIAVRWVARRLPEERLEAELRHRIDAALQWLHCQEHPRLFLLQQNEASDWADIMPRSGYVLYTNALWYHVKQLFDWPHAEETKFHFNHLFFPFSRERPDYRRLRLLTDYVLDASCGSSLYLSFVNLSFWGEEGDVFGNVLAVLFGLADPGPAERVVETLSRVGVGVPFPARSVCRPLEPDDSLWRSYMDRHQQNRSHQYHNGGVWPFIGGFWAMALLQLGRRSEAETALEGIAEAGRIGNWGFFEWFHGQNAEPNGMRGQSWNAAMYLLAEAALDRGIELDV
ncbi:amylo-alpha-1,6-glucosidase [Thiohalomonas denitrificans]|uniref:amylo-alpha-1,6-glucosidase n=1 Tax=Thiohalomonas denitrificans TaxID=415747 RepID=UPI0026ECCB02|nr:glycoside hydrolase 100 family protein [Thiohalomonas denitrificans]